MDAVLRIGGIPIDVKFKDIKNVHLSVYPPTGRVHISAPRRMNLENVRLFAISKIGWIKRHQGKISQQERESPREYLERESHYVWGRRYLLRITESNAKPGVALSHRTLQLTVPKNATFQTRHDVLAEWYRAELRKRAEPLVVKWSERLGVKCNRFYVQRMKTKWGSSSPTRNAMRLNLGLARLPLECLDYVVLHEIAHFLVPNHSDRFVSVLNRHMPGWGTIRNRLGEGPLPAI